MLIWELFLELEIFLENLPERRHAKPEDDPDLPSVIILSGLSPPPLSIGTSPPSLTLPMTSSYSPGPYFAVTISR